MRHTHTNNKRSGAITIEYLIIVIIILGIGASLLSFQGEIKNAVTTTQQATSNLVDNMLQGNTSNTSENNTTTSDTTTAHTEHDWCALVTGEEDSGVLTSLNKQTGTQHICSECEETQEHQWQEMDANWATYLLRERVEGDFIITQALECPACEYWEIRYVQS